MGANYSLSLLLYDDVWHWLAIIKVVLTDKYVD